MAKRGSRRDWNRSIGFATSTALGAVNTHLEANLIDTTNKREVRHLKVTYALLPLNADNSVAGSLSIFRIDENLDPTSLSDLPQGSERMMDTQPWAVNGDNLVVVHFRWPRVVIDEEDQLGLRWMVDAKAGTAANLQLAYSFVYMVTEDF